MPLPLDYTSMLLALGFSAACLAVTLLGSWLTARSERFMLTWGIGVLFIVANIFAYSAYVERPGPLLGAFTFALLMIGFSTLLSAARQFRTAGPALRRTVLVAVPACAVTMTPMAIGYDGLAFIIYNAVAAVLLVATAREYWRGREEAPAPILGIVALYGATAASFLLCSLVLAADGELVMGKAPANWAEDISIVVAIAGMSGIGALSLALNQWRLARHHRREARTDELTGLLNRRALFDAFSDRSFGPFEAVVVFDLDHFKAINDTRGHACGDAVLRRFAEIVRRNLRSTDMAARLGGEEFAAVLMRTVPDRTSAFAERIRRALAREEFGSPEQPLGCTVSAGVAFGTVEGSDFETVLREADAALYGAKDAGRDRVGYRPLKRAV